MESCPNHCGPMDRQPDGMWKCPKCGALMRVMDDAGDTIGQPLELTK